MGLTLPDGFLDAFRTHDANRLFVCMKMSFHAVTSISPLVLLLPINWNGVAIRRDHLLTVRANPVICCQQLTSTSIGHTFIGKFEAATTPRN